MEIALNRSAAIPDEHDEKMAQLRARLTAAQYKISQAQAEVRTMQVEAGAIARNYTPPRRQASDEGHLA